MLRGSAMFWMCFQKIPVEILMPNVMLLEDETFGMWLGHEEEVFINENSAPTKEAWEGALTPPTM